MHTVTTLDELAGLVRQHGDLYVRWSRGPEIDTAAQRSKDELTSIPLPGLSANSLAVPAWWNGRSVEMWVARRLYDYRHLRDQRSGEIRPWVLQGDEVDRGPDNEPLVRCRRAVAWIADEVVADAERLIESAPADWGPLDRRPS